MNTGIKKAIRFGIIGCGVSGARHAVTLSNNLSAVLNGVASKSSISARKLSSQYKNVEVMTVEEMIHSSSIDAICICSPNKYHFEQAFSSIVNGKHVLIEKPISMTGMEATKLLKASKKNNVLISCVLPRRYDKTWVEIQTMFCKGILGKIKTISLEQYQYRDDDYYRNSGWHGKKELDGGILYTQAIHYVDLMLLLLSTKKQLDDDLPIHSIHTLSSQSKPDLEYPDTIISHFKFGPDTLCSLNISTAIYPGQSAKVFISSERGSLSVINDRIASWNYEGIHPPDDGTNGWKEDGLSPVIGDMIHAIKTRKHLNIDIVSVVDSLGLVEKLDNSIAMFK